MTGQLLLPVFEKMVAAEESTKANHRIERHIESMRCCWPEWHGPVVSNDIHGRCSVGIPCVFSEKYGEIRYHYCAPCKIIEVSEDGTTIRAAIDYRDYPEHVAALAAIHNNTVLRLHITEVWPPVAELIANRK